MESGVFSSCILRILSRDASQLRAVCLHSGSRIPIFFCSKGFGFENLGVKVYI